LTGFAESAVNCHHVIVTECEGQGGSIDANVQRWVAQFETPDGKPLATPAAKKAKINKLPVTRLDLEGTYLASAGPRPSPPRRPTSRSC